MNPYVALDEESPASPQRNLMSKGTQTSNPVSQNFPTNREIQTFDVQDRVDNTQMNLESEYQCYICWLITNLVLSGFGIFLDLVAFSQYNPPVGLLFLDILINAWNLFHINSVYTGIKERNVEKIETGISSMYLYLGAIGIYAFIYVNATAPYYQRSDIFLKQVLVAGISVAIFYYTIIYFAVQIRDLLKPASITRHQQERPLLRV